MILNHLGALPDFGESRLAWYEEQYLAGRLTTRERHEFDRICDERHVLPGDLCGDVTEEIVARLQEARDALSQDEFAEESERIARSYFAFFERLLQRLR